MGQTNGTVFLVCILPEVTWENGLNENIIWQIIPGNIRRKYRSKTGKRMKQQNLHWQARQLRAPRAYLSFMSLMRQGSWDIYPVTVSVISWGLLLGRGRAERAPVSRERLRAKLEVGQHIWTQQMSGVYEWGTNTICFNCFLSNDIHNKVIWINELIFYYRNFPE